MPGFSFHIPRFLRSRYSRRSRSIKSSPAGPRDDAATSDPPCPSPSPALSSRPPSTHGAREQAMHAAAGTSHSLVPNNLTRPHNSSGCLCANEALEDSSRQPSQVWCPITQTGVNHSISTPKVSPQDSITQQPATLTHLPDSTDSTQSQHPSCSLATLPQQSSVSERQSTPLGKDIPSLQHPKQEIFTSAHDFTMVGANFIDNNKGNVTLTNNINVSNNFMKDLLKETIPGAAADSSARDPPPRCHPGTRLAILDRCLYFIANCNGVKKMRWIVGAAGVGKSAVMQNVAESPQLLVASKASVFLSINGRNEGSKTIMTLSYQFAAKSEAYRRLIEGKVASDPQLLQSSMPVQFENFIAQPFIHNAHLNSAGRVLIIIDGLDECNNTRTQIDLLRLISNFCISYPSSPIVWLIASRPEPHITSFFSRPEVVPAYEKEEIAVDSDEARADVERFLRHELTEIGRASDFLGPQWPDEPHLWKLAKAAGGLFAYAHTVIRYIGDSNIGDPVSQLSDVLNVIAELPMSGVPREEHPMALLDALYARILSKVPLKIMMNARKLLLLLASDWDSAVPYSESEKSFIVMCNWLGMAVDEAYAAVNRLRSVLYSPPRHKAHEKVLKPFHKSFIDYISRSEFFLNIKPEAQQLKSRCAFRVLEEAPSGVDFGDVDYRIYYGELVRNGGTGDKISITWRVDEGIDWDDDKTRLSMYKLAIAEVVTGMERGEPAFQTVSCIKLLTTRFQSYLINLSYRELRDFVFDKSRCHEFMKHGILKRIPAKAIEISNINTLFDCKMQFYRPVATTTPPDSWNSSCEHDREGQWEQEKEQSWTTVFDPVECTFCFERLKCQWNSWITRHPDHAVSIMFASEQESCVEFRFVDLEDDVSEWTYWLWIYVSSEERKKLGSAVYY